MSVQTPALFCIFIAILLPDWLSSAELHPSANQLAPPYIPFPEDYPYFEDLTLPLVEEERTRPSARRKRLMGIFRCNGWGPGCTQLEGGNEGGAGGGGRGHGRDRHYHGGEAASNRSPIEKFQPFFTLTSGGSWGPTGKRSVPSGGRRQMTPRHTEADSQNDLTSTSLGDMTSTSQLLHHLVARDRKFLRDRDQSRETLLLDALRRLADESRLLKRR